jgi:hypothetical protein
MAALLAARWLEVQLRHCEQESVPAKPPQFSIRHLMMLTLVVGCSLALGRWFVPLLRNSEPLWGLVLFSLCFAALGLAAAWAMLAGRYPPLRSIVVLLLAVFISWIPAYVIDRSPHWFWISMMVAEACFLLASLLVVRACGDRLVRRGHACWASYRK